MIEACWLFSVPESLVDVVIHPQSVVHSMVQYRDGSVLAQLGNPDMRTPIAHALAWPERIDAGVDSLDMFKIGRLDFEPPDPGRFPCLRLAQQAWQAGGTASTLLNAANEVAVQAFLDDPDAPSLEEAARLIALDGYPLAPRDLETLVLGPAQRADVVIDGRIEGDPRAGLMLDPGNGEWVEIAALTHAGEPVPVSLPEVRPLPAWGTLPEPNLSDPQHEALLMEGGAMRGMREARYRGEMMDFRELAENGMVWAFNSVAHGMDAPMFRAARGRTVHMELTNRSMFPHAIHLHGHHFRILPQSGASNTEGDVRDTVLVGADETVAIAFVADNPGRWMIHCHMLSHQKSGMMGWFEVA